MTRDVDWLLVAIMVLGPIQWVTVADLGLALKPVHVPLALMGWLGFVRCWTSPLKLEASIARTAAVFAGLMAAYVCVLLGSVIGSPTPAKGVIVVSKIAAQAALIGLGFLYLAGLSRPRILNSLVIGGAWAGMVFVAFAWVTLEQRGLSLPGLIHTTLITGDPRPLQFKLFLTLFNDGAVGGVRTPASLRQVSMGFLFIGFIAAVHRIMEGPRAPLRRIAILAACLSFLVICASLSRSFLLLVLASMVLLGLSMLKTRTAGVFVLALTLVIGVIGLGLQSEATGVIALAEARFGDLSHDGRINQFGRSWAAIAEHPFFGHGAGYAEEFRTGRSSIVHNILLSAWVQAGIFGVLSALCLTGFLCFQFLTTCARWLWCPDKIALAMLFALPLFRSQLGGFGGNYALGELLALALGLILVSGHPDRQTAPASLRSPALAG